MEGFRLFRKQNKIASEANICSDDAFEDLSWSPPYYANQHISSIFLSIKIGSSLVSIPPSWMDIGQSFIGLDSEIVESSEGEQQCYIPLFLFEPIPVNA